MDMLKQIILFVMTEECFEEYFISFDFFNVNCFKSTLSKCLGIGLIAGSILVKLPQIIKLYISKSGEGLSLPSILLDLTAITIHVAYNFVSEFPFNAWGDGAMLGIQTLIVAVMVFHYGNETKKAVTFTCSYFLICFILMGGLTPLKVLWFTQACNVPILVSGKLLQAWENYKNGSTGQLSAATVFMLTLGSIARIFTSIQETGDLMMVITFCASTAANLVLAFQMIYYWNVMSSRDNVKKNK